MMPQPAVIGILKPLVDLADTVITFLHDNVGLSWGFSIVGLTVIVRLILLPLTMKQIKSMNRMKVLQPQMKEIQEKYKDDPQRKNQEMMKFYKENNVNPLASCLPLVLQIPVFLALYQLLNSAEFKAQLANSGFLFIDNLSKPAKGSELIILIVLYVVSQLASSVVMAVTTEGPAKYVMFVLPFVFIPFIINFPAGLIVYWITTNLWTFGQQVVVRRLAPPVPVAAGAGAAALASPPPKRKRRRGDDGDGEAEEQQPQAKAPAKAPPPPPRKKKRRRR